MNKREKILSKLSKEDREFIEKYTVEDIESLLYFEQMYNKGYRFISKEDYDSFNYGAYREHESGAIIFYTIKTLLDNTSKRIKITEDTEPIKNHEIEKFFNLAYFWINRPKIHKV